MISEKELLHLITTLEADALERWIEIGWVLPEHEGDDVRFDDSDVARVRLICELHYELRIEEDSMPVVLSLMDQLYQSRRSLSRLMSAIEAQPDEVRSRIASHIKSVPQGRG